MIFISDCNITHDDFTDGIATCSQVINRFIQVSVFTVCYVNAQNELRKVAVPFRESPGKLFIRSAGFSGPSPDPSVIRRPQAHSCKLVLPGKVFFPDLLVVKLGVAEKERYIWLRFCVRVFPDIFQLLHEA